MEQKFNGLKILLFDDDLDFTSNLSILLEDDNFQIFIGRNIEETTDMCRKVGPDLVIIGNPRLLPANVVDDDSFNRLFFSVPGVVLAESPTYEDAVKFMKMGACDYFDKYCPYPQLLRKIEEILSKDKKKDGVVIKKCGKLAEVVNFIVICGHALIIERLKNFSDSIPCLSLVNAFKSVEEMNSSGFAQHVAVALICADCNISGFDDSYKIMHSLYKRFAFVKPVIFNENFSEEQKVELLKIGVKGFFKSEINSTQLTKALLSINKGEIWANRRIANLAVQSGYDYLVEKIAKKQTSYEELTQRELEIIKLMTLGLKNREIGDKIFISEATVKTHITNIFKKLGVNSRSKAIYIAKENKLI
jgi:DNA-binding NarL/FixJ family response regulator